MNPIIYKTEEEIALMTISTRLTSETLAAIATIIKPGIPTVEIDKFANEFIRDHGAIPSFYQFGGFPYHICTSVNDAIVHGMPNHQILKEGDIVSVDAGAYKNGFHGDQAYTFIIGEVKQEVLQLVKVTKESLLKGIEQAVHGNRVGDISYAIESHIAPYGYGIVRELVGHGLGRNLHEGPDIPNYGQRGKGKVLKENLVIAIEPMVNLGTHYNHRAEDGWTIRTNDRKPAVHFEQDVCIKKNAPLMLTDIKIIEEAEKSNCNLNSSYY